MFGRIRSGLVVGVAACGMAGAIAPSRLAAQNITPSGDPIGSFTAVGLGWYSDVGQSFTAGGAYMTSFSFWLGPSLSKNYTSVGDVLSGVDLFPYVMAWDGSKGVGTTIYTGSDVVVSGLSSYQKFDFSTTGLALTPGAIYVAFLQAANDGVHTGNVKVGFSDMNGSGAVADNLEGAAVKPLTDTWDVNNPRLSATFAATFSDTPVTATPEPVTMMLLATGMAGLFGAGRFRRKRR
jgi:hypothetical protein